MNIRKVEVVEMAERNMGKEENISLGPRTRMISRLVPIPIDINLSAMRRLRGSCHLQA
jgi:hypothetical protein